ncbi:MAG: glutathione peroxidase [Glaciecola sp.]|jgi:glutathione peroxidase|nr:glutathione peroxidase [Glaciecola sp.]MDG1815026.1 glutathione peroxidase [Glaciecola sp.]MDG2100618.1 glutathione peroxidase [Glaciecola sp.]
MKKIISLVALLFVSQSVMANECPDVLKFMKRKLNSQETVNFCEAYKDKAILFVNTASKCGFTPQFDGLEKLYNDYKDKNFVVLGFPSGDFNQEFDDEGKTAELCELTYGVKFPMFETIAVRGDDADPLYRLLANKADSAPKWNFYKYLVDRKGNLVDSYSSFTKPQDEDLIKDIERAILP